MECCDAQAAFCVPTELPRFDSGLIEVLDYMSIDKIIESGEVHSSAASYERNLEKIWAKNIRGDYLQLDFE